MRKPVSAALIITMLHIFHPSITRPLEVDREEIKTRKVTFTNYKGTYRKKDSIRAIEEIGLQLGRGVKKAGPNTPYGFYGKYSVIRILSAEEPDKFQADIISIDRNAKIGHISNVRRITAAYLTEMYGYSRDEARALALFISYYNAVYRGNVDYFQEKYKSLMMKHINAKNAGIATHYSRWPGATKLIIPLTGTGTEEPGKIDPFTISDRKVNDQVRKDESSIDERKDLHELKKRDIDEETTKLKNEKILIAEKEKILNTEEKKIQKNKDENERQKKELENKKELLRKEKDELKSQPESGEKRKKEETIKEKERKLDEDRNRLEKEEQKRKADEDNIREKKEELKKKKDSAERKDRELEDKKKIVAEEKKELEKDGDGKTKIRTGDEKKILEQKETELNKREEELDLRENKLREKALDENIYDSMLYYLKVKEYLQGGHYNNELYMIDPASRKIVFKSPIDNICGRRYDIFSKGIVVITHLGNHQSGHRLTLIDRKTLKPVSSGDDDVFWRSFIEIRDDHVYAIMVESGRYYLGKYDLNFKIVARSGEWINEDTFISFFGDYIYINRYDKQIMVLNKNDLTLVDVIKP